MDIRDFEIQMKNDIETVFTNILKENNYILPISAKSRSGAEISDYLEDSFVNYFKFNAHPRISKAKGAPKDNTKSPYDFEFIYTDKEFGFNDLIWGDIKATKHTYKDSNPDLGTPNKIIKFIKEGHFYLMFVFLEYEPTDDNELKFIKFSDNKYVHCQFLKDINHTVRINPKPQFQVNINQPEEYRTKDEFLELFYQKYNESIDRNIKKQTEKKEKIDKTFRDLKKCLKDYEN